MGEALKKLNLSRTSAIKVGERRERAVSIVKAWQNVRMDSIEVEVVGVAMVDVLIAMIIIEIDFIAVVGEKDEEILVVDADAILIVVIVVDFVTVIAKIAVV